MLTGPCPANTSSDLQQKCSLYLSEAEIAAFGAFAERSRPLETQARQTAVDPLVVFAEDLRELGAAQLREGAAIRTGDNVHPVLALFLRIEDVLKAVARREELLRQRVPGFDPGFLHLWLISSWACSRRACWAGLCAARLRVLYRPQNTNGQPDGAAVLLLQQ